LVTIEGSNPLALLTIAAFVSEHVPQDPVSIIHVGCFQEPVEIVKDAAIVFVQCTIQRLSAILITGVASQCSHQERQCGAECVARRCLVGTKLPAELIHSAVVRQLLRDHLDERWHVVLH